MQEAVDAPAGIPEWPESEGTIFIQGSGLTTG